MRLGITLLLLTTLFWVFACEDSGNSSSNQDNGFITLRITDGPYPLELIAHAFVTITKIELRNKADSSGNPYHLLTDIPKTYDLIKLRNGNTEDLPDIQVPVGSYDLIRLHVSDAQVVLTDSSVFDLKVPSGAQTGIKVFVKPNIIVAGGLTEELIVDFDLSRSFKVQGNPNKPAGIKGFIFSPVVKAVNASFAGRLNGFARDINTNPLENVEVTVANDSLEFTAFTDSTGFYELMSLKGGLYSAFAYKEGFDTVKVDNIEIINGNKTSVDFTLE